MITQEDARIIEKTLQPRFDKIDQVLDRLSIAVVNVQAEQRDQRERIERLEKIAEGVYQKLDDFIGILKKQEIEHIALRSRVDRLEERLVRLEQQAAT